MAQGLKAVGKDSINMGWIYGLKTKTGIEVAIARKTEDGWIWTLVGATEKHTADSLEGCVYAVEEQLGIPHAEPKTVPPLKRVKVGDQSYELRDRATGDLVGTAVKTGTGRDNYPWDWSAEGTEGVGVAESLKSAIEAIITLRSK